MLKYEKQQYIPVVNTTTEEIPPLAMLEITATTGGASASQTDVTGNFPFINSDGLVYEVKKPTANNLTLFCVNGPFPIRPLAMGFAAWNGLTRIWSNATPIAPTGLTFGTQASSFEPLYGGDGLEVIDYNAQSAGKSYLCRFNRGRISAGANLTGGGATVASGAEFNASPYSVTGSNITELSYLTSPGRIAADVEGTYQFGFSFSASGPSSDNGSMMIAGLYNATDAAYTGHYAAAENFWDTTAYATVSSHTANIAMTGLVNANAGDVFDVRNASAFSYTYSNFNFWMLRNG